MNNSLSKLYQNIFNAVECNNGNHYFVRYNDSNLICKWCGRFAKVGYLHNDNVLATCEALSALGRIKNESK